MIESDVVIVGAGLAGLYAAKILREQGLSITVLEARERVGGKVYSVNTPEGRRLDLGAQWIGPDQTRMLNLVRSLGLRTIKTYRQGKTVFALNAHSPAKPSLAPPIGVLPLLEVTRLLLKMEKLSKRLSTAAPWQDQQSQALDQLSFSDWLKQSALSSRAARFLELISSHATCANPNHFSALELLYQLAAMGGGKGLANAEECFIAEGAQTVAERLATNLGSDLHLNCPVRSLTVENTIRLGAEGGEFAAKQVILALPLQMLSGIRFTGSSVPDFGRLQGQRISGRVIKSVLLYEHAWWRAPGLSGTALLNDRIVSGFVDGSPEGGSPGVLVAFSSAGAADRLRSLTRDAQQVEMEALVTGVLGKAPTPAFEYYSHDWNADCWSLGGYASHSALGFFLPQEREMQRQEGPVHLAGSETARHFRGYMEGALASAERASEAVLRALA